MIDLGRLARAQQLSRNACHTCSTHCHALSDAINAVAALEGELLRLRAENQNARDVIYVLAAEIAKARDTGAARGGPQ